MTQTATYTEQQSRITSMDLDNVQRHRYDVESGRSAVFSYATTTDA